MASHLNRARWIWRNAPHLITAEEFPEPYASAFENWETDAADLNEEHLGPDSITLDDEHNSPLTLVADPTKPGYVDAVLQVAAEGIFDEYDVPPEKRISYLNRMELTADSIFN